MINVLITIVTPSKAYYLILPFQVMPLDKLEKA
jgi:hypothetical protein